MRWIALLSGVVLAGCVGDGVYRCSSAAQCARRDGPGRCEADGFCSFADSSCTAGRRYGAFAARAGACVGELADGDVEFPDMILIDAPRDGGSLDDGGLCGALGERCCAGASCTGGLRCTDPAAGACVCHFDLRTRVMHSCVRRVDQSVWCWGRDGYSQLGGTSAGPGVPKRANPILLPPLVAGAPGGEHTLVLGMDGKLFCVGGGFDGQCGDGTMESNFGDYTAPRTETPAAPLTGASAIASGKWHSCALVSGSVYCWGANDESQLGYPTTPSGTPPRPYGPYAGPVMMLTDALALVSGGYHNCVLKSGGTVWCWGANNDGQLAISPEGGASLAPVQIPMLSGVREVTLGITHSCALIGDVLWCWGSGQFGELGDGQFRNRPMPYMVAGLGPVAQASAGGDHTCAVQRDGKLLCWGSNEYKQLGRADLGGAVASNLPLEVPGITDAVEVAAGDGHTCVLRKTGQVQCWGSNSSYQLGSAVQGVTPNPVTVQLSCTP